MSIVRDADTGKPSSKRVMGIVLILVQQLLFIYKEITDRAINNPEIFIGMIATGASLLGISVFEYFAKRKQTQ